jgi:hypothetical protein
MPKKIDHWDIKGMPASNQARRRISAYAELNNITLAEAIAEIVKKAKI